MRRLCLVLSLALLWLAGCGSRAEDPWLATAQSVLRKDTASAPLPPLEARKAEARAAVRASDYAGPVLLITLPHRDAVATFVIVSESAAGTTWMDAGGISVTLRGGGVIATRGLGDDIIASDLNGTLAALRGASGAYTIKRRYLNAEGGLYTREMTCTARQTHDGLAERCSGGGHVTENLYVRSGSARTIVASRQWLGPRVGSIEIERLR